MKKLFAKLLGLFSARREKSFLILTEIIGYKPKDLDLFKLAFTHKSSPIIHEDGTVYNNERLEFLGDAILDAIVADALFNKFPDKKEGFLTNSRARLVNRAFLNAAAAEMGLDKLIVSTSTHHQNNILGNALEALIGAVYIDGGYNQTKAFIAAKVLGYIDNIEVYINKENNFKSRLLEWSQKNKKSLKFDIVSESVDKSNTPTFVSEVTVEGIVFGKGKGSSKKESHQDASRKALKELKKKDLI